MELKLRTKICMMFLKLMPALNCVGGNIIALVREQLLNSQFPDEIERGNGVKSVSA